MGAQAKVGKPPYRVPSMDEIRALLWNGFTAVSTFSGCGGSSLGYRMAGFRMAWASEFISAAAETYRANASPSTVLDTRDIRQVKPEDILEAAGLGVGEIDLFDGSPPCSSFSTAGKREKGWNQVKAYSDTRQRTDDLFYEYARLVEGCQPRVFVAENVSGLVKGTAKGYFKLILARLRECGYRVEARLLDASWLGVPQARQRLIFIGVRNDLGAGPVFPKPLPYQYTVRDALPWITAQKEGGGLHLGAHGFYPGRDVDVDAEPSPTICAGGMGSARYGIAARVVHDTSGQFGQGDVTDKPSPAITVGVNAVNSHHYQVHGGEPVTRDPETGKDITIGRYAIGKEWQRLKPGESTYYGGRLWKPDEDAPAPTITQKGSDVTAASVAHWSECRKLTLGELRRLGGFPDDFALTGTYEQRWERIGRAVPPVMMSHIAAAVRDSILVPLRENGAI